MHKIYPDWLLIFITSTILQAPEIEINFRCCSPRAAAGFGFRGLGLAGAYRKGFGGGGGTGAVWHGSGAATGCRWRRMVVGPGKGGGGMKMARRCWVSTAGSSRSRHGVWEPTDAGLARGRQGQGSQPHASEEDDAG